VCKHLYFAGPIAKVATIGLEVGKDADLVIFDEDLNVHYTILGGEVVYARR